MENILMGKILKAMQKLSGKTVGELAEDADMTIDTVNNLFYARVQKPSFVGVCRLVECMGFTVGDLLCLLREDALQGQELPTIMEAVAARMNAEGTEMQQPDGTASAGMTRPTKAGKENMEDLRKDYLNRIQEQYEEHLSQAREHYGITISGLEKLLAEQKQKEKETIERYDRQIEELKREHRSQQEKVQEHLKESKRISRWLAVIAVGEILLLAIVLFARMGSA